MLNPVSAWLSDVANIENRWNTFRLSVLNGALIYGFVAVIGVALLLFSHWHGSPAERRVVRNIAVLLFVGGLFGGPVSTASYWAGSSATSQSVSDGLLQVLPAAPPWAWWA